MIPQPITCLGLAAGLLGVLAVTPQVLKVVRTRKTRDLSLGMWLIVTIANSLWTVYGVLTHCWPLILSNGILTILCAIILRYKLRYH